MIDISPHPVARIDEQPPLALPQHTLQSTADASPAPSSRSIPQTAPQLQLPRSASSQRSDTAPLHLNSHSHSSAAASRLFPTGNIWDRILNNDRDAPDHARIDGHELAIEREEGLREEELEEKR